MTDPALHVAARLEVMTRVLMTLVAASPEEPRLEVRRALLALQLWQGTSADTTAAIRHQANTAVEALDIAEAERLRPAGRGDQGPPPVPTGRSRPPAGSKLRLVE
ncbi:hypothetical protein [Roseomonas populi]|uniref:Uncharacterized protein n=1 Tax=Roseomonas populi TaxID=3121582 RepID=A0ABT1WXQ0_9PROT|nr:hypothetical protein [Roseomonas pecuniae]MCR0980621.1 hypothetical protein [Roseomonas pecuniae]